MKVFYNVRILLSKFLVLEKDIVLFASYIGNSYSYIIIQLSLFNTTL
jgi:hypothetical protein